MDDETKKRAVVAIETAIKLRMLAFTDDHFLRFVSDVEMDPSPTKLEQIERWNADMAAYLAQRAEQARQPAQPAQPEPRLEQFAVPNNLIN